MCPIVLRLIMNMYTNQEIRVKWNTLLSSKCKTSNGVKQGGCLSPILFSGYLNNLIVTLRNSNIGCRYRSEYMGVFGYADDLSLVWPSFSGMKEMLNVCQREQNPIQCQKSQILHFSINKVSENNRKPKLRICRKMYALRQYFKFHLKVYLINKCDPTVISILKKRCANFL